MVNKVIVESFANLGLDNYVYDAYVVYLDTTNHLTVEIKGFNMSLPTSPALTSMSEIAAQIEAAALAYATTQGYTGLTSADFIWCIPKIDLKRTTSSLSLSLVGTGATGTQISATKDSTVRITVSLSSTSVLLGNALSAVVLKKCATNSATEGDWSTVTTPTSGASGVAATVSDTRQISADIPAGWYIKVSGAGSNSGIGSSHSESIVSADKTIIG